MSDAIKNKRFLRRQMESQMEGAANMDDTHLTDSASPRLLSDLQFLHNRVRTLEMDQCTHLALVEELTRALELAHLCLESLMNGDENDYDAHQTSIEKTISKSSAATGK